MSPIGPIQCLNFRTKLDDQQGINIIGLEKLVSFIVDESSLDLLPTFKNANSSNCSNVKLFKNLNIKN